MTEVEKERVRAKIEEYLAGKKGYDLKGFGNYEKIEMGGATWIYIVEVDMVDWDVYNYAFVPVVRANPLGIVMMTARQLTDVVKALIDGLEEPF